jgi:hypothetical protein
MPTKHNKNYGAVFLPLLILWPALTALAENEEVIARCAKIPSVGDRILCLEDALRVSARAGETAIDADAVAEENPTPDSSAAAAAVAVAADDADLVEVVTKESGQSVPPDAVAAPAAEETMPAAATAVVVTVNNADVAEEVTKAAGQSEPLDVAPAPQADDTLPAAVDAVTTTGTAEAQQFGLSEVQKQSESLDSIDVIVVAVSKNAYGKLIFTTGSDQVWQQTDQGTSRYRKIPFEATIRKGASGSHFIQPQNGGVSVRVKRRN